MRGYKHLQAHLEGSLIQLWLRFPAKIAEHEVGNHLYDRLFYGMHKGFRDSIIYIDDKSNCNVYSINDSIARKAESEVSDLKGAKPLTVKVPSLFGSSGGERGMMDFLLCNRRIASCAIEELCKQFTNLKSLVTHNKKNGNGSNTTQKKYIPHSKQ